jgi:dTDP-glucose 4,6-dehydratase
MLYLRASRPDTQFGSLEPDNRDQPRARVLLTGGCGFIGTNFVRHLLARPDIDLLNLDLLTYAGNRASLAEFEGDPRYQLVEGDIADQKTVNRAFAEFQPDLVVNMAAESHVDRSIEDPAVFIRTNVQGTRCLLDAATRFKVRRFLQVSTDEVYGSLGPTGLFTESTPLDPSSPYSASKAGADLLVQSWGRTFDLPWVITRCSNNYGPYQFPEKLIPRMITLALSDRPLPVYGDGLNVRDWIHVEDHCTAIEKVMFEAPDNTVWNVGGSNERTNLQIVRALLELLGKSDTLVSFVQDRRGHDRRYAMDATKLQTELGWAPARDFETGLEQTVRWYLDNQDWWRPLVREPLGR